MLSQISAGIHSGQQRMFQAASQVAQAGQLNDSSLTKAAVELMRGRQQVEASAEVLEVYRHTLDTLLSVRA